MFKKIILMGAVALIAVLGIVATVSAKGGFDEFGYNDQARVFNGTGSSWCLAGGQSANCVGIYSPDKLVMKWNAAWDDCNDAGNDDEDACAGAWTSNEWNGNVPGGSGEVWHYKIIWVGSAGEASDYWREGGYLVWNNYEVIMDQGTADGVHTVFAHAVPNGYGGR